MWWPTHIVLCFCFVFLRLVYPMLSISLDCPFLIAPSVFSNVYLSVSLDCPFGCLTFICQFLWIVQFWLPLRLSNVYLSVSLDCAFLIAPLVFSNVYLSCILCTLCCQFLWIVHFWLPLWYSLTFICQFLWSQACRPASWQDNDILSDITFLELFPVVAALHIWGTCLKNKKILFHIDNLSVVSIINKNSSKSWFS